jgi:DNA-binding transcriptional regulator LsrR (DeoR family)
LDKYAQDLMIKVSELYYIHEMTQQQIANRLRISRVKVSRILTNAKKRGIIEININYPIDNCVKLERKFETLFNLKEALIISNKYKSREIIYNEVTRIAAKYLLKIIQNGDVLGVSWLRTLSQMSNYIKYSGKKVDIIQMLGNLGSNDISADEVVRRLSNAFNGKHYFLPAPAIVDNEKIKNTIMSDSSITQVFRKMKTITVAIVGIGNLIKESTFVTSGYLKKSDIDFLRKSNSVGDICGRFFDEKGNVNDTCFNRRVIGIDLEQLKKIPYVIGIVSGTQKAIAILGALRSGVLDVLITDEDTALEVYQKS